MSDIVITVRGEHEVRVPAELGIARVSVRIDGPDRAALVARAEEAAARLRQELRAHESAGAVARWTSDSTAVWSDRPWSQDGTVLPLVHHAVVETRSEFSDPTTLAAWIAEVSEREGVAVDGVEWELTRETTRATEATVAEEAVRVAVARARAYASALGASDVTPLEIADVGLLGGPAGHAEAKLMSARLADSGGSAPGFQPRAITVSAAVDARFRTV